ncbi:26S proteasome non-ATPase regulatory subunit 4 isoform X2 [Centruroides vittatus]|uniref:26S proteasome non-ATPase regulatory subunit 4 isoform X2 n=1 Tax=Centruroides vittatus TaxID=120091 RepID=UPI00350EA097
MGLESTIVCVDNSEFMRNGDFIPTRLQAQQDAVSLVCHSKTRSNPENNVGLLTLANPEVLATLTTDVGRILSKLHQIQPNGTINFLTGIRIAHLALKHRQGKNHKMRIVVFVGSPVEADEKELLKLAKRLKKEKVNVDVVNFGEDATNSEKLTSFINTINGREGTGSHLVTVPPGPHLSDALISSPVIQGEDGSGGIGLGSTGFEFGVDPNEDPELALALRVSMEEQRQRQEDEARRAAAQSSNGGQKTNDTTNVTPTPAQHGSSEEALLEKALQMSLESDNTQSGVGTSASTIPDFAMMTEDEQIAYAMQMSLQHAHESGSSTANDEPTPMDVDSQGREEMDDYSDVMRDPEFLQSVLQTLPGVDPQSEAVRNAMGTLTQGESNKKNPASNTGQEQPSKKKKEDDDEKKDSGKK